MNEPSAVRQFKSRVLSAQDECADVKTFKLAVPDDFHFIPGMWVMLHFADKPDVKRAYSISSSPLAKGAIEISLNKVGDFSQRMFGLKDGDEIDLAGPYGKWRYRDDARAVLISGGTGLTPFRAMGRYVLDQKLPNKLAILYSARTPADILYKRDLEAFQAAGIQVHVTITRGHSQHWDGPAGRLSIDTVKNHVEQWKEAAYYLCGPKTMVSEFTAALEAAGIARENIHYEKWGDY